MLKLAIRVPVLSAAVLGGSLMLADGMVVAALMVSFVSLVLLAAMARISWPAQMRLLARVRRTGGLDTPLHAPIYSDSWESSQLPSARWYTQTSGR